MHRRVVCRFWFGCDNGDNYEYNNVWSWYYTRSHKYVYSLIDCVTCSLSSTVHHIYTSQSSISLNGDDTLPPYFIWQCELFEKSSTHSLCVVYTNSVWLSLIWLISCRLHREESTSNWMHSVQFLITYT